MRHQLIDIIASNYHPLQREDTGGDGVAQQFSSFFVTEQRLESFQIQVFKSDLRSISMTSGHNMHRWAFKIAA